VTLPSIELRQGAKLDNAIALLQRLRQNCVGAAQPAGVTVPVEKQVAYVQWATTTEGELGTIISIRDAAAFFESPRHRDICSMTPGTQLLPMISAEVNADADRLGTLADELHLARRLFDGAGTCLVPDTSFYIEHPEKIADVNFHELAQTTGSVRVLIPMVVVDELDSLKKSRDKRWRAGYSLAVIDRVTTDPPWPSILSPATHLPAPPRGEVTFQIVFDPPRHERMPINDDEIVDRALACQPFTDDLTVITYDTGQSQRARTAGLKVKKLPQDLGPEPGTGK
jgi:hypothetical protein